MQGLLISGTVRRLYLNGKPQPPVLHRTIPGRGYRGWWHFKRCLHHGCTSNRQHECFGDLGIPTMKTRHLVSGVIAGVGGYGNCVGVPTVGGECNFHHAYDGNILVNAMTVGVADADKIFYSAAAGIGNSVVYVGSKTGRDGIHGATMASAEFTDDAEEKRPTVQVGDPFTEKLLIEACLELMLTDSIVAIQDMGAAGLPHPQLRWPQKVKLGLNSTWTWFRVREKGCLHMRLCSPRAKKECFWLLNLGARQPREKSSKNGA